MNRHLDGIYFRVKRNEKWKSICLSDMTKEERHELLEKRDAKYLLGCVDILCDSIKKIGDIFDIAAREDDEDD